MPHTSRAILIAAMWGCGTEAPITEPIGALAQLKPTPRYEVVKLSSSLGGTASRGDAINNHGWVTGFSNLPGNQARHATLWRGGSILDLGTLGGPSSSVQWPGLNSRGTIVGISQTAETDPLGEEWSCSAFLPTAGPICLGFVWENGVMRPLPTLGGNNGFATGVNSRGEIVGWAETPVHDPTCNAPQVLQFRAVRWRLRNQETPSAHQLPPYPGDSTSAATAINERGQVVGISGECDVAVGRFSARHAVLWDRGQVIDLGNLGGTSWHTPMAINERGDIVGFSNPAGPGDPSGEFIAHAFLWTRSGGMKDLGTLPGDETSQAFAINERRQVVGVSSGPGGNRAFLWQNGVMRDLGDLVAAESPDALQSARDIDDAGQITGNVLDDGSGSTLTFVATPKPRER